MKRLAIVGLVLHVLLAAITAFAIVGLLPSCEPISDKVPFVAVAWTLLSAWHGWYVARSSTDQDKADVFAALQELAEHPTGQFGERSFDDAIANARDIVERINGGRS